MANYGKENMKPLNQITGEDIVAYAKSIDKQTWIKIGAAAFAAFLIFYFILWPAWFKRAEVKAQIAGIEANVIRLQTLKRKEKTWLEQKQEYTDYIKKVKERLYLPGETSLLLGKISKLATESGVSIIASTPRDDIVKFPKPYDERYKAELYDFTVEGGYHQLGTFVSKIESSPKILRIEHFRITPREKATEIPVAEFTLSAVSLKQAEVQK